MPGPVEDPHRSAAVQAFNEAWDLIDRIDRSPTDDERMLAAAFASRYHWEAVGGEEERAIGEWQIAHVASLLGMADLARRYAEGALRRVQAQGWTDWRLASCSEGVARAAAVAGDAATCERNTALAREVLAGVDDADDRALVESQLATIPHA